jgi:hypothetical protein
MNAGLAKAPGVMMKLDFERAGLNRVRRIEAHPELCFRQVLLLCDEWMPANHRKDWSGRTRSPHYEIILQSGKYLLRARGRERRDGSSGWTLLF